MSPSPGSSRDSYRQGAVENEVLQALVILLRADSPLLKSLGLTVADGRVVGTSRGLHLEIVLNHRDSPSRPAGGFRIWLWPDESHPGFMTDELSLDEIAHVIYANCLEALAGFDDATSISRGAASFWLEV